MYEVIWFHTALDRLADIFATATLFDQERMAGAVETLNRDLAKDPYDRGESRDGIYRVVFLPLLRVWFRVDKLQMEVRVTSVIRYGK